MNQVKYLERELEKQSLINRIVAAMRAEQENGTLVDAAANVTTGARFYVAITSVMVKEDVYDAWILVDLREHAYLSSNKRYLSAVWAQEFDRHNRRVRVRSLLNFSEHMCGGEVVDATLDIFPWEPLIPDSVDECVMQFLEENHAHWRKSLSDFSNMPHRKD